MYSKALHCYHLRSQLCITSVDNATTMQAITFYTCLLRETQILHSSSFEQIFKMLILVVVGVVIDSSYYSSRFSTKLL